MSLLRVQSLIKSYRLPEGGTQVVLDVPEFALAGATQLALRGPSGTGKTTFLHTIAGILTPDAGTIEIDGSHMTGVSEGDRDRLRARTLGYVYQTFNLLQGFSALENVELAMMFAGRTDRTFAKELLARVGLSERLNHRPSQMSVGQQQRVAIARALANRPKLLLADEPTGNLDAANGQEALRLIRELCREAGAALLLVSHDPAILAQFDDVQDLGTLNRATRRAAA